MSTFHRISLSEAVPGQIQHHQREKLQNSMAKGRDISLDFHLFMERKTHTYMYTQREMERIWRERHYHQDKKWQLTLRNWTRLSSKSLQQKRGPMPESPRTQNLYVETVRLASKPRVKKIIMRDQMKTQSMLYSKKKKTKTK